MASDSIPISSRQVLRCIQGRVLNKLTGLVTVLILVAFVSAASPPAWGLWARWPDLEMRYRLNPSCEAHRSEILLGIVFWQAWLPDANWTEVEVPGSERLSFTCFNETYIPGHWPAIGITGLLPVGGAEWQSLPLPATLTYAGVYLSADAFNYGSETVIHELGHVWGLGETGHGLTIEDINEVRQMYGYAPIVPFWPE